MVRERLLDGHGRRIGVRAAVRRKKRKHHVGEEGFRPPPRTMSAIGG